MNTIIQECEVIIWNDINCEVYKIKSMARITELVHDGSALTLIDRF